MKFNRKPKTWSHISQFKESQKSEHTTKIS